MRDIGADLLQSAREMNAILRGDMPAPRVTVFEGGERKVYVNVMLCDGLPMQRADDRDSI